MFVIRPVKEGDWKALWHIANQTGPGFSSLQPCKESVSKRLNKTLNSFAKKIRKEDRLYIFCLEDIKTRQLAGVSAIISGLGLDEPWYNFRLNTVVHASQRFNIFHKVQTLTLCNDYTGCSELCMLFLLPEYRSLNGIGHLLSKSRFLFLAAHPYLFNDRIIAEMRGVTDEQGETPFWEALGRKFMGVDFIEADQALSNNRSFVIELMPRHTIYMNMLPENAQRVIGLTHQETLPAIKILYNEGFKYRNYVAPFDAGPVLEAYVEDIRAVQHSFSACVSITKKPLQFPLCTSQQWLISNKLFEDYRCIMGRAYASQEAKRVMLTKEQADALNITEGDYVSMVPVHAGEICEKPNNNTAIVNKLIRQFTT
ncbi:MAG: arginine N-succinyltransferase [Endozoicomonadaceae bacterium]|nr:arginine N-succinyltransferase [Endozoicomonadaceae bacterium]